MIKKVSEFWKFTLNQKYMQMSYYMLKLIYNENVNPYFWIKFIICRCAVLEICLIWKKGWKNGTSSFQDTELRIFITIRWLYVGIFKPLSWFSLIINWYQTVNFTFFKAEHFQNCNLSMSELTRNTFDACVWYICTFYLHHFSCITSHCHNLPTN